MKRLEIRLLGGFEARLDDRLVSGFESQKVRAMLAYLAMHPGQVTGRERLASLLWAEKPDDSARRNLRQALHNLRTAFARLDPDFQPLEIQHKELSFSPQVELVVDVAQFEDAARRGLSPAGADPYQLAIAARLYSGDFLSGFFIKDSPPFEDWLLYEQERLRDAAVETYRTLIHSYIDRGEYRLGIQYARRLLATDPLSEEAHRYLMRLNGLSGRRSRALAQYEELKALLRDELAVEPLEETTALYESILTQDLVAQVDDEEEDPVGPLIPLVGRGQAFEALQESWRAVAGGTGRLTVIRGESGVGKTRLARSFVDVVSSQRRLVVLRGRSYDAAPVVPLAPFVEVVTAAVADFVPDDQEEVAETVAPVALGNLLRLAPEIEQLSAGRKAEGGTVGLGELAVSIVELLRALSERETDQPVPVVLLLDDLQWADRDSHTLLAEILPLISDLPFWVLACQDPAAGSVDLPAAEPGAEPRSIDYIDIERLSAEQVEEIAFSLVGVNTAERLGELLVEWSAGLPLAIAELVNFLWDEKILVRHNNSWSLVGERLSEVSWPDDLKSLMRSRIRSLPTSARRLLSIAATVGQRFDVELIQTADGESLGVVEICIQQMLERWLIRQFPRTWFDSGRERDLVLWAKGVRRGSFDFAHEMMREAILEEINPLRQGVMHRAVAETLWSSRGEEDLPGICERLCYHLSAAGDWERADQVAAMAVERAARLGARAAHAAYLDRRRAILERVIGTTGDDTKRAEYEDRRRKVLDQLASASDLELADRLG